MVLAGLSVASLVLAVAAVAAPLAGYVMAASSRGASLGDGPIEIRAPGGRVWGVYVNDADNSGYSESCTVTDSAGRVIALRKAGPTISSSDSEMLDLVFDTPSDGHFTIGCDVRGATARVGPVPNLVALLIGIVAAVLLGTCGLVTGTLWLTGRAATPLAVP
jgi:hypothetical protein